MATRDISIAKENNRMRQEGSMSQINRYVVLNKSHLFERKVCIGTDCVENASAPGIPVLANASNGRRNAAQARDIVMKVSEGDGWEYGQMYA
jgi:hypothetical protein